MNEGLALAPSEKILEYHKRVAPNSMVVYYPGADRRRPPVPAIVLQVFHDAITVRPIGPDGMGPETGAIRHIDDQRLEHREQWRAEGAWDFSETERTLWQLVAKVAKLEQRVAALEGKRSK